jgi:hypothetical protein
MGQVLEKVLLAGVKLYAQVVASGFATLILTVPVLTHPAPIGREAEDAELLARDKCSTK